VQQSLNAVLPADKHTSFLDLPLNCTTTFSKWKVLTFLELMEKTGLGPIIDTTQNLTCLTPTDQGFLNAGTSTDNITAMGATALFHILKQPVYSSFLQDGDEFETLSNETVRVSILNGDIYFNDALVLKPNVFTNNGLMYEIDRVMSPLSTAGSGSSSSATPSATSESSSSSSGPATVTVTASPTPSATPSSGAASGHQVPVLERLGFLTSLICVLVM
jgi:transforming growth factor-beta-induced protein